METHRRGHRGKTIVNAAGAWVEDVGQMAGAMSIGLVPMRRTAIIIDAPEGLDVKASPVVDFLANGAYIKPEVGKLTASPVTRHRQRRKTYVRKRWISLFWPIGSRPKP
jgi:D-arginine dehydrogenase